ncbi:hypothetical protein ACWEQL_27845 [Kitasatospora sp. NPDC004240]
MDTARVRPHPLTLARLHLDLFQQQRGPHRSGRGGDRAQPGEMVLGAVDLTDDVGDLLGRVAEGVGSGVHTWPTSEHTDGTARPFRLARVLGQARPASRITDLRELSGTRAAVTDPLSAIKQWL